MKKSPSTPNLNWRYTVAEDAVTPGTPGVTPANSGQEQVVKRRQRKVQKPRPRSEIREKTFEETWIDGDRYVLHDTYSMINETLIDTHRSRVRPASYIDAARVERDYYIQTCKKPVNMVSVAVKSIHSKSKCMFREDYRIKYLSYNM